jgi:hypothetical protein
VATETRKPKLVVIPGGLSAGAPLEGPVTRLGLRNRFPRPSRAYFAMAIAAKVLLLAAAASYFIK